MIRGTLYFLWMALTVVPYGTAILLASIFVRGRPLYRVAMSYLNQINVAARVFGGIRYRWRCPP